MPHVQWLVLHPHNFISNVVVSLTIHDNIFIYTNISKIEMCERIQT